MVEAGAQKLDGTLVDAEFRLPGLDISLEDLDVQSVVGSVTPTVGSEDAVEAVPARPDATGQPAEPVVSTSTAGPRRRSPAEPAIVVQAHGEPAAEPAPSDTPDAAELAPLQPGPEAPHDEPAAAPAEPPVESTPPPTNDNLPIPRITDEVLEPFRMITDTTALYNLGMFGDPENALPAARVFFERDDTQTANGILNRAFLDQTTGGKKLSDADRFKLYEAALGTPIEDYARAHIARDPHGSFLPHTLTEAERAYIIEDARQYNSGSKRARRRIEAVSAKHPHLGKLAKRIGIIVEVPVATAEADLKGATHEAVVPTPKPKPIIISWKERAQMEAREADAAGGQQSFKDAYTQLPPVIEDPSPTRENNGLLDQLINLSSSQNPFVSSAAEARLNEIAEGDFVRSGLGKPDETLSEYVHRTGELPNYGRIFWADSTAFGEKLLNEVADWSKTHSSRQRIGRATSRLATLAGLPEKTPNPQSTPFTFSVDAFIREFKAAKQHIDADPATWTTSVPGRGGHDLRRMNEYLGAMFGIDSYDAQNRLLMLIDNAKTNEVAHAQLKQMWDRRHPEPAAEIGDYGTTPADAQAASAIPSGAIPELYALTRQALSGDVNAAKEYLNGTQNMETIAANTAGGISGDEWRAISLLTWGIPIPQELRPAARPAAPEAVPAITDEALVEPTIEWHRTHKQPGSLEDTLEAARDVSLTGKNIKREALHTANWLHLGYLIKDIPKTPNPVAWIRWIHGAPKRHEKWKRDRKPVDSAVSRAERGHEFWKKHGDTIKGTALGVGGLTLGAFGGYELTNLHMDPGLARYALALAGPGITVVERAAIQGYLGQRIKARLEKHPRFFNAVGIVASTAGAGLLLETVAEQSGLLHQAITPVVPLVAPHESASVAPTPEHHGAAPILPTQEPTAPATLTHHYSPPIHHDTATAYATDTASPTQTAEPSSTPTPESSFTPTPDHTATATPDTHGPTTTPDTHDPASPGITHEPIVQHSDYHQTALHNGHVITGSAEDGTLTYDGKHWDLVGNGVKNIQHLVQTVAPNQQDAVTKLLTEHRDNYNQLVDYAQYLYKTGQLSAEKYPELYKLFHLANGTTSNFDKLVTDKETLQAILRLFEPVGL